MRKKLLIHLGPPKTATTSFQNWLKANQGFYTYLGINQPRKPNNNLVYNKFWLFINKKITINELKNFVNEFETEDTLILSEEMILINDWKSKVERLKELEKFYDLHLSYCYRSSKKVIPSYYAEIHSGLPEDLKNDYNLFLGDDRVNAYDLKCLSNNIDSNLNIFEFKKFTKGNLSLNKIFNLNFKYEVFNKKIMLIKENVKSKRSDNEYLVIDKHPSYPTKLKPYLKRLEKKMNIDFRKIFQRNYHILIENSEFVDELELKNERFLNELKNIR